MKLTKWRLKFSWQFIASCKIKLWNCQFFKPISGSKIFSRTNVIMYAEEVLVLPYPQSANFKILFYSDASWSEKWQGDPGNRSITSSLWTAKGCTETTGIGHQSHTGGRREKVHLSGVIFNLRLILTYIRTLFKKRCFLSLSCLIWSCKKYTSFKIASNSIVQKMHANNLFSIIWSLSEIIASREY